MSSIKSASPCCDYYDQSCNVRQLHSPVKLEPLEASGLGGPWWRCCMLFLVVGLCMCVFWLLCVREAVGFLGSAVRVHMLCAISIFTAQYFSSLGISFVVLLGMQSLEKTRGGTRPYPKAFLGLRADPDPKGLSPGRIRGYPNSDPNLSGLGRVWVFSTIPT